ncbi:hypothetical protein BpHYR1_036643 [Brachionus plicatilis]|uniref:Uncharacterized protein n=1 Tax=Brachionus plicatilis TaxID=10195 RepID=A0A3M7SN24_BRAPC|nr:hypothetical protein BpHYR1_036643 [Brachionus plicatilis]
MALVGSSCLELIRSKNVEMVQSLLSLTPDDLVDVNFLAQLTLTQKPPSSKQTICRIISFLLADIKPVSLRKLFDCHLGINQKLHSQKKSYSFGANFLKHLNFINGQRFSREVITEENLNEG